MNRNNKSGNVLETNSYIEDVILTFMWDDGFYDYERSAFDYNKNYQIPLHSHEYYEFTYNGHSREFIFEESSFTAEPEHLIIIPPKLLHVQRMAKKSPYDAPSHTIMMMIRKSNIKTPSSLYEILSVALKNVYYEKVPQRVAEIMKMLDIDNPRSVAKNRLRFSLLMHELLTLIIESSKIRFSDDILGKTLDTFESRIYKIDTLINENYSDNLSLELIAKKVNISERQLSRIIKKQYGCTFKEVLTTKRINRAKHLLRNTNKKISEISTEIGYNSDKSFYSSFISNCGCSPSEYRKSEKQKTKIHDIKNDNTTTN